ncbi:MAG: hypothetical protein JSS81_06915 [Acidobacteria bacterium]|nr:hypothetical protein [Acidobacteriota bacterium]
MTSNHKKNSHEVALAGRQKVEEELRRRGAKNISPHPKRKSILEVSNGDGGRTIRIHVKTKRKGHWHSNIDEGRDSRVPENPKDETAYWIFVDLADQENPRFRIVGDEWIRNDINKAHQAYLSRHGGRRRDTPDSKHHSIDEKRIREWADKWENLDIFG